MSYEEFWNIPETLVPHELIDGEVRSPGVPTVRHQSVLGNLLYSVGEPVRKHRLGYVVSLPVDVVLDKARPLVLHLTSCTSAGNGPASPRIRCTAPPIS